MHPVFHSLRREVGNRHGLDDVYWSWLLVTRFLHLYTLSMVIGSISLPRVWVRGHPVELPGAERLITMGLGAGGDFLSSMGEGVPLALARFCRGTALSGLGVVVVADEPGVGLRLR